MNYGQAKTRASRYINNRGDIDFDDYQALLLDDINQGLDVQENEGIASLVPALSAFPDISSADLPDDFGRVKVVKGNKRNLTPTDIQTLLDGAGTQVGQYAISGMCIWVQSTAALQVIFNSRVPELVNDNDTNAILSRYPKLYIYGLAKHANNAIQDFDAAATYEAQFMAALADANASNVMAIFSAGVAPTSPYLARVS